MADTFELQPIVGRNWGAELKAAARASSRGRMVSWFPWRCGAELC